MKKFLVRLIHISHQEGLLVYDVPERTVGVFNHKTKTIVFIIPWKETDFDLPKCFDGYKIIVGVYHGIELKLTEKIYS